MIGIINYGSGNVFAIANVYKRLNIEFVIIDSKEELFMVDKLILPGVGAFDEVMLLLEKSGLKDALDELVIDRGVPILGVCVGMQVMGLASEEGRQKGLGWIKGNVKKIDESVLVQKPYVPHLGWNSVAPNVQHELFKGIDLKVGFYFLHTFYFECESDSDVLLTTKYGIKFASAVNSKNVYGVQFHPEKSHKNGIKVFENFAKL